MVLKRVLWCGDVHGFVMPVLTGGFVITFLIKDDCLVRPVDTTRVGREL